jgi:hypothetical protein
MTWPSVIASVGLVLGFLLAARLMVGPPPKKGEDL